MKITNTLPDCESELQGLLPRALWVLLFSASPARNGFPGSPGPAGQMGIYGDAARWGPSAEFKQHPGKGRPSLPPNTPSGIEPALP